jgi:hypothetical protein
MTRFDKTEHKKVPLTHYDFLSHREEAKLPDALLLLYFSVTISEQKHFGRLACDKCIGLGIGKSVHYVGHNCHCCNTEKTRKRFGVLLWLFIFSHGVTIIQVRKVAGKIETFLFNEHWLSFIITMIRDVSFYTLDSINAIHGKQQVITLESSR